MDLNLPIGVPEIMIVVVLAVGIYIARRIFVGVVGWVASAAHR